MLQSTRSLRRLSTVILLCAAAPACSASLAPAVKSDLEKQLALTHDPIAACYAKALETNQALAGKLYLKFRVNEGAKTPSSVEVSSSDVKDVELDKCITLETQDLRLAEAPDITIAVTYPLEFASVNTSATAAPAPAPASPTEPAPATPAEPATATDTAVK